jgi:aromatic ring hydroxylase
MNIAGFASAQAFGRYAEICGTTTCARENDIVMTHTLVNPQIDRSRPRWSNRIACAKVVKETDAGIVVSNARMVSRCVPMPTTSG